MSSFSGTRLRDLRIKAGLTRTTLAVAVSRSYPSITQYETNAITPPTQLLPDLATALGCEIGDLFDDAPERVSASRRGQGLPDRVEDPATLERVSALVREGGAHEKTA